ncbi:pyridoxamine 5'-phosphate oxidase family protein [Streptomyces celluloflavus]|uniref:pyridoxamine 5'-phosphate oxidase family protein n=1 Tax=Streptomyces celluloflavus TaxID=58344 RepID=UPI0036D87B7D
MPDSPSGAGPVPAALYESLARHTTLTLAYCDEEGPGACAVDYATRPGPAATLLFTSAAATRHGRRLHSRDPRCAFTVQQDGQDWSRLTGVQGTGSSHLLTGPDREQALAVYESAYPFVAATPELRTALSAADLWELRPDWLRLVDNSRGFGHKQEWAAPGRAQDVGR